MAEKEEREHDYDILSDDERMEDEEKAKELKKIWDEIKEKYAKQLKKAMEERAKNQPKDDLNVALTEEKIDKAIDVYIAHPEYYNSSMLTFMLKLIFNLRYDMRLLQMCLMNTQKVLAEHLGSGNVEVIDVNDLMEELTKPPHSINNIDSENIDDDIGGFYS